MGTIEMMEMLSRDCEPCDTAYCARPPRPPTVPSLISSPTQGPSEAYQVVPDPSPRASFGMDGRGKSFVEGESLGIQSEYEISLMVVVGRGGCGWGEERRHQ